MSTTLACNVIALPKVRERKREDGGKGNEEKELKNGKGKLC
jgi:hypothetical protein